MSPDDWERYYTGYYKEPKITDDDPNGGDGDDD